MVDLQFLLDLIEKWCDEPGSDSLKAPFKPTLTGGHHKMICERFAFVLWRAIWAAWDKLQSEGRTQVKDQYPIAILCALFVSHSHMRKFWSILWSTSIPIAEIPSQMRKMKHHIAAAGNIWYYCVPGMVYFDFCFIFLYFFVFCCYFGF